MYDVFRKLDQKSPVSGIKDDELSHEEELVFEKISHPVKSFRPASAKGDFHRQKSSSKSRHLPINIKKTKTKKFVDYSILSKLKPRRVNIDKERLYEENMALKLKNNNLLEELIRLRTKVSQVEKELNRKEDQNDISMISKPAHMINSLKLAVKDLKLEISNKNDEINKLKKHIKSTKINEIELQVQAYIDECTRLRHHLEEVMRQRDSPQLIQNIPDDKTMQASVIINSLKKENEDLNLALNKTNEENLKLKEKVLELEKTKKKTSAKKGEMSGLKGENSKMKKEMEGALKECGEREVGLKEEIRMIKKNLGDALAKVQNYENKIKDLTGDNEEKNKKLKALQERIDLNDRMEVSEKKKLEEELKKIEVDRKKEDEKRKLEEEKKKEEERMRDEERKKEESKKQDLEKLKADERKKEQENRKKSEDYKKSEDLQKPSKQDSKNQNSHKSPSDPEASSKADSTKPLTEFPSQSKKPSNPSKPAAESVESIFTHFSFRMQINRIPKTKLFSTLFGTLSQDKQLSKTELSSILKKPPFNFLAPDVEAMNNFLLDSPKSTAKSIETKIHKFTEDWEVFTPEDEETFDEKIGEVIQVNKEKMLEECKKIDKANTGIVSLDQFKEVLDKCKVKLQSKVIRYMMLLFYSHNMRLNEVPYFHFIKAYGENADDDVTDEEKAKIVRHYLGVIAEILVNNKKGVFDVFECDEQGLLTPDDFYAGLGRIGLAEIEEEHVMLMLEALQLEDTSEVCIHIEELEEILKHYGVESGKKDGERIKKVSMLDSDNLDLSEDSPGKARASSKGLSESSPFKKNRSVEFDSESDYDEDFQ